MAHVRLSMRWWLALTFAAIAALTAFAVATVFNHRAAAAVRQRSEDLAIGESASAAHAVFPALRAGRAASVVAALADERRFSLYVFGPGGHVITAAPGRRTPFAKVPDGRTALEVALGGDRYVASVDGGRAFVVGLRLRSGSGAIVTYTPRPELLAELGIVHDQILDAALIAVAVGALVGLLVSALITARLRRIAGAAARIEAGAFDEPLRPRFGDELGALAETIDQMRERLRESFSRLGEERDRLRQLLEGMHEGVIAVDHDLRVTFANRAARRLLPNAPLDTGNDLSEAFPDFPLRSFAHRLFVAAERPAQARVTAGERVYALAGVSARRGGDAILVLSDISEQERRERAEREFVANAAHELGTPLTAIASSLEVLQAGAKEDAVERDRFLALIERQTVRLSRLRRALLALARAQTRQEPLRLEPVPARHMLDAVAVEARSAHGAEVVVSAPPGLVLLAHRELVEQLVLNLIENAFRHGGASCVELIARHQAEGVATIEVLDDGAGIPAAERDLLFDRFYRGAAGRDGDGFGLGLAIVREAVRALGGTIDIESPPGGGTVVRVALATAELRAA